MSFAELLEQAKIYRLYDDNGKYQLVPAVSVEALKPKLEELRKLWNERPIQEYDSGVLNYRLHKWERKLEGVLGLEAFSK